MKSFFQLRESLVYNDICPECMEDPCVCGGNHIDESAQLDEISSKTMHSYKQQAHTQVQHNKFGGGKDKPGAAEIVAKREKGMDTATSKLQKKEKERIAALPKRTPTAQTPYKPLGGRDEVSGRSYSEEYVDEGYLKGSADEYRSKAQAAHELYKRHEEKVDHELRKVGERLPKSWNAGELRKKLSSHPKYAQALVHYNHSEKYAARADHYDDLAKRKAEKQGVAEGSVKVGDRVHHNEYGKGVVRSVSKDGKIIGVRYKNLTKNITSTGYHSANDVKKIKEQGVAEESELGDLAHQKTLKHRVLVTYSDPNHTSVSMRKEKMQKHVLVPSSHKGESVYTGEAEILAKKYMKKKGYRVHGTEHVGLVSKKVTEETLDELSKETLQSYVNKVATGPSRGKTQTGVLKSVKAISNVAKAIGKQYKGSNAKKD